MLISIRSLFVHAADQRCFFPCKSDPFIVYGTGSHGPAYLQAYIAPNLDVFSCNLLDHMSVSKVSKGT